MAPVAMDAPADRPYRGHWQATSAQGAAACVFKEVCHVVKYLFFTHASHCWET
jgi:hypothetical protein